MGSDVGGVVSAECCHLCGGRNFRTVSREGKWRYVQCGRCGLIFLDPRPAEDFFFGHYQGYLSGETAAINAWGRLMRPVLEKSAALIEEKTGGRGRLLDVGCGYGFFMDHMARGGWDVEGIEISEVGRGCVRRKFGLEASAKPLPRPDLPDESFDVVSLFYVIEHLPDPSAIIAEARRLLRKGGLLFLRWPHTTPLARLLRPWANSMRLYQAPSHLYDFSPSTIRFMLERYGFRDIRTTVCGWTLPEATVPRVAAIVGGIAGEWAARWSGGRLLVPGASKTTTAVR